MVLVPEIENVLCPICLDVPFIPRFTRCGHIYCLPCLLQFFQTSESTSGTLGNNWRYCPVCAEALHLKQLRPVKFCPATEPKKGEMFNSLLIKKCVGSLHPIQPQFSNDSLSTISPFQRSISVDSSFFVSQILNPELNSLRGEVKKRKMAGENSLELSFYEAAIKTIEDCKKQAISNNDTPNVISNNSSSILSTSSNNTILPANNTYTSDGFYYFHQSRDGLNVFLHPLCMKILKYQFETYESIPAELSLPIIQLERIIINGNNRKRFKYLDHLSSGTQIILVEVDLSSIVSNETLFTHQKELLMRKDARDQKIAWDSRISLKKDRSILEEWKMMEDDYYSITQATAAMDIKVPESVKLDNLDDEMSFPLPSSYNAGSIPPRGNNFNSSNPCSPSIASAGNKKSSSSANSLFDATVSGSSPSFSALAHSLNSPFTFNHSVSNTNNLDFNGLYNSTHSGNVSGNVTGNVTGGCTISKSENITSTNGSSGKKKIVLFSSGLNLKRN